MSSYDEHLISQAGGDGDELDQIQRRHVDAMNYPGMVTIEQSQADVPYLLALVREQAAKLEAVRELAEKAPKMQNMGGWSPGIVVASDLLAALEATK